MRPEDIIRTLQMRPHPEGGWYVQTFKDSPDESRGHSTAIYYLLQAGEHSHWHRVHDAAEVWHHYMGAPLALYRSEDGMSSETLILGTALDKGERPQVIVPSNWWQAAETLGDYTLVGCTVAPGFVFSSFEMAPPDWKPLAG